MNITTLLLLATSLNFTAVDSLLELQGKIVDASNGDKLIFATIELYQNNSLKQIIYSDVDGTFRIEKLEAGIYSMEIAADAMKTKTIEKIRILPGKKAPLIIKLDKKKGENEILDAAVELGAEGLSRLIKKLLKKDN